MILSAIVILKGTRRNSPQLDAVRHPSQLLDAGAFEQVETTGVPLALQPPGPLPHSRSLVRAHMVVTSHHRLSSHPLDTPDHAAVEMEASGLSATISDRHLATASHSVQQLAAVATTPPVVSLTRDGVDMAPWLPRHATAGNVRYHQRTVRRLWRQYVRCLPQALPHEPGRQLYHLPNHQQQRQPYDNHAYRNDRSSESSPEGLSQVSSPLQYGRAAYYAAPAGDRKRASEVCDGGPLQCQDNDDHHLNAVQHLIPHSPETSVFAIVASMTGSPLTGAPTGNLPLDSRAVRCNLISSPTTAQHQLSLTPQKASLHCKERQTEGPLPPSDSPSRQNSSPHVNCSRSDLIREETSAHSTPHPL